MRTSFLSTRVCALAYADCTRANGMGFISLFDGIPGVHACTARAVDLCC